MPDTTHPRPEAFGARAEDALPTGNRHYVIERTSEFIREWWTGSGWSDIAAHAQWYELEPDAPRITQEEEAESVHYPNGVIEAG